YTQNEGQFVLTQDDRKEIKRLIAEVVAESRPAPMQESASGSDAVIDVTARAVEVFGSSEKAMRWLRTPVRSLGDRTPLSLLGSPEGVARVQDTLGRVEHGVW